MEAGYDAWPRADDAYLTYKLQSIISDLKNDSDIKGAVLLGESDSIIASDLPMEKNYITEIPKILSRFKQWYDSTTVLNGMFAHCILDYNGCRVVAKKLGQSLTLLVMLEKPGYLGLAMLDIESSVQQINWVLKGGANGKSVT